MPYPPPPPLWGVVSNSLQFQHPKGAPTGYLPPRPS